MQPAVVSRCNVGLTMDAYLNEVSPGITGVAVVHRAPYKPLKPNLNA